VLLKKIGIKLNELIIKRNYEIAEKSPEVSTNMEVRMMGQAKNLILEMVQNEAARQAQNQ
jgi:hypothetical protein